MKAELNKILMVTSRNFRYFDTPIFKKKIHCFIVHEEVSWFPPVNDTDPDKGIIFFIDYCSSIYEITN